MQQEIKPALGCTEPIAVALAVAKAKETLGCLPQRVELWVSCNILKNAMGVGIPGTGMAGLPIAIALGALIGKSGYQLEVLRDCTPEAVERGKKFIAQGGISIIQDKEACDNLYVDVVCKKGNHRSEAIIAHEHTRLVYLCIDNNVMLDERSSLHKASVGETDSDLTLRQVFDFATQTSIKELAEIAQRLLTQPLFPEAGKLL